MYIEVFSLAINAVYYLVLIMKKKALIFVAGVVLLLIYVYTIILIRNNTKSVIKKDMQTLSSILYAANIVLLDVEQSIEQKYAEILYSAAVEAIKNRKGVVDSVDVAYYVKNGSISVLKGAQFVNKVKTCMDTIRDFPIALDCNDLYIYAYPGQNKTVVVGILKKRVEDQKSKAGLSRFFNELSRVGLFFYVALEDMNGVVYSTVDSRLLTSLKEDSSLLDVYVEGKENTRIIEFLGKKVLETAIPFSYGSFRGIMRIGLDASEYVTMEKRVIFEVTVLYIILFFSLLLTYIYLEKARKARADYRNIRKALEKTSVPIVIKKGEGVYSFTEDREFKKRVISGIKDGEEVFVRGTRYIVKKISMENEVYFLFISMEKEDMKRKIMEYEAIGRLIGEVAHEIKNPLNGISLLVQTLSMESERSEYREILDQVKRIEGSLDRFVALLAPLRLSKRCVSQRDIIYESLKVLGMTHNNNVVIQGDVTLLCDRDKMREVYVNILKNAIEASPDNKIEVEMRKDSIIFRNKGKVPEHVLDRIFEPFFTTKDKGTGLGMYYVKKIVEAHGWHIKVENIDGVVEVKIEFSENFSC